MQIPTGNLQLIPFCPQDTFGKDRLWGIPNDHQTHYWEISSATNWYNISAYYESQRGGGVVKTVWKIGDY